jgi:hypothetical protein
MAPNKTLDQDLLTLFSDLIGDKTENEILKILYSEGDEESLLDELIKHLEIDDDQD